MFIARPTPCRARARLAIRERRPRRNPGLANACGPGALTRQWRESDREFHPAGWGHPAHIKQPDHSPQPRLNTPIESFATQGGATCSLAGFDSSCETESAPRLSV